MERRPAAPVLRRTAAPVERFRFADRSITPDIPAARPAAAAATRPGPGRRPAGVSRWVNAHGTISLAGFSYPAGASYAEEPVEAAAVGGLVDILHAGVVIATHAQQFRPDQADRVPRARGPASPSPCRSWPGRSS